MSPALSAGGWRVAPLVVVKEAAVAVEVGEVLGAGIAVVLIGPVWAMCGRLRAVKGLSTSQRWSEQPCVRPLSAAHRAAGHNALRGSGPGQKLAFDDALAQVGCPDHRIDRFCITCCLPFPAITPRLPDAISFARRFALTGQRDGFPVAFALGHHRPGHARDLVGERDRRDFRRPPFEQLGKPGAMLGAVDLGVADHR